MAMSARNKKSEAPAITPLQEGPRPVLLEPISYTIHDAALVCGATEFLIGSAIREGKLPAKKLGKKYVVLRQDLQRFVEQAASAAWNSVNFKKGELGEMEDHKELEITNKVPSSKDKIQVDATNQAESQSASLDEFESPEVQQGLPVSEGTPRGVRGMGYGKSESQAVPSRDRGEDRPRPFKPDSTDVGSDPEE
jgi:hypothetical protein